MDVVKNEITAIGGRVDIATTRGAGTTFTVYLPLTLAVTQAVLVRSGGSMIALASAMVEQVLRLKGDVLAGHYESRKIEFQDRSYPLHSLQQLLGVRGATEAAGLQLGAAAAQRYPARRACTSTSCSATMKSW